MFPQLKQMFLQNLLKKQVETRTPDGRRRITPLCIAQLDTGDFSPALFNSAPILPSGSSMSNQLTSQLSSDSSPGPSSSLGLRPGHDPMLPEKQAQQRLSISHTGLCPPAPH
ncbi:protein HIRA-like [Gasterosteus aculeatus]